jgi:hypothetical protein
LPDDIKFALADYIKLLADTEDAKSKIIIVGINKAGQSLLNYAADLAGRIDTISFESNPENKVEELISKGEKALNITINIKKEIIEESQGSFQLTQMLCHECCVEAGILEEKDHKQETTSSMEVIRERVLGDLSKSFLEKANYLPLVLGCAKKDEHHIFTCFTGSLQRKDGLLTWQMLLNRSLSIVAA